MCPLIWNLREYSQFSVKNIGMCFNFSAGKQLTFNRSTARIADTEAEPQGEADLIKSSSSSRHVGGGFDETSLLLLLPLRLACKASRWLRSVFFAVAGGDHATWTERGLGAENEGRLWLKVEATGTKADTISFVNSTMATTTAFGPIPRVPVVRSQSSVVGRWVTGT